MKVIIGFLASFRHIRFELDGNGDGLRLHFETNSNVSAKARNSILEGSTPSNEEGTGSD